MSLKRLDVANFRNLEQVKLELSSGINLIFGDNGSGKTSLLEAVYFLATGRSSRSGSPQPAIQHGKQQCVVTGVVESDAGRYSLGVSRSRSGEREIRVNGESPQRTSDLARLLPTLLLGPESIELIIGAPSLRRRFLNWGLFHVEPRFTGAWEEANRCLKQRNLLLRRDPTSRSEITSWTSQLVQCAEDIDRQRQKYIERYKPFFDSAVARLTGMENVTLDYYRGWDRAIELFQVYENDRELDQKRGFTQKGFQRADVRISVDGQPVAKVLSRGELKSVVWAMTLAQGELASNQEEGEAIYLIDDLAAEFDREHRERVCRYLAETGQQIVLTGVEKQDLLVACNGNYQRLFHVKHGEVVVQET